jgi:predicted GNAT family acetyltransferase
MNDAVSNDAVSIDDSAMRRYQLIVENRLMGFIQYYPFADIAIVTHTEVDARQEGRGYGSELAKQALDYFRSERKQLVPVCGFFAGYIRKHPEYADLVTPASRRIFEI